MSIKAIYLMHPEYLEFFSLSNMLHETKLAAHWVISNFDMSLHDFKQGTTAVILVTILISI